MRKPDLIAPSDTGEDFSPVMFEVELKARTPRNERGKKERPNHETLVNRKSQIENEKWLKA